MRDKVLSVLLHTLEIVLMLGAAYAVTVLFGWDVTDASIVAIITGALLKAQREFGGDYVNRK